MFTMWAHMTAELMKTNARDAAGSSCGQQTAQGACVSNRAVQDRGRRFNQSYFRFMAEVSFLPSTNTRKRASASRETEAKFGPLSQALAIYFCLNVFSVVQVNTLLHLVERVSQIFRTEIG